MQVYQHNSTEKLIEEKLKSSQRNPEFWQVDQSAQVFRNETISVG
jgi:hypothetical protein